MEQIADSGRTAGATTSREESRDAFHRAMGTGSRADGQGRIHPGTRSPRVAIRDNVPMSRRADLSEFLRARRGALRPEDVGLEPGSRRRTVGLRREEVALLAGVSVSWYTWLEQGRPINASLDVLDALARVLRLDPIEREHLLMLAGLPARRLLSPGRESVPASIERLLTVLEPAPAYVLGPRWDFLAWNVPLERLYPGVAQAPVDERNLVWAIFTDPTLRALIVGWEGEARRVLSQFRAEIVAIAEDPAVVSLVERLMVASPEFADWWPRHDVAGFETHRRTFAHPTAGTLMFDQQQLVPAGEPDLRVVVHLPIDGDDSASRISAGV
jgi:transcriptional regulator with XRE-family HTH domain